MVAVVPVMLRERSVAVYVSVAVGVVERTANAAQPFVAACEVAVTGLVPCEAPPVLEVNTRLIESVALVTALAASLTQTVIVDWDDPFAGIGFGAALATRCVAVPAPTKLIVLDAGVSPVEVAVAVHDSTTASAIVNVTVVPLVRVLAVAGLPAPPAGVVLVTVAPQAGSPRP